MDITEILRRVDHTDLGVTSTEENIRALCADAAMFLLSALAVRLFFPA